METISLSLFVSLSLSLLSLSFKTSENQRREALCLELGETSRVDDSNVGGREQDKREREEKDYKISGW